MKERSSNISLTDEDSFNEWMTTYADLMTLLLVFFVLLFSLSTFNLIKFKEILESIRVNPGQGEPTASLLEFIEIPDILQTELTLEQLTGLKPKRQKSPPGQMQEAEEILDDINQYITQKHLGEYVVLEILDGKIVIRIHGKILFPTGTAQMAMNAEPILDDIVSILKEYAEYNINIKGYTDNVPISTAQFASNWDLSAIRATAVLKHLIKRGISAKRLTATGYGDMFPIVPNTSERNRAINRRVEFVLEKENQ
ncbi:MAG: flagellar motor protein MotB [Proteobacteria bacterium]|nr:flagellar motor protein MotB [Pseudomonadota bacterium]